MSRTRSKLVVPIQRVHVENQRPAGVAHVGHVPPAAGQPPDQERVHGAEQDFAAFGPRPQAVDLIQQVLDLGAGEIGVDHQSGLVAEHRFEAVGLQPLANLRTGAALPDHRVGHGFAGVAIPQDGRFPLVGDAYGRQIAGRNAGRRQRPFGHRQLRRPNRLGVVLDVSRTRQDLLEFLLCGTDGPPVVPEHDRAAGSGALVEAEDELGHGVSPNVGHSMELKFYNRSSCSEPAPGSPSSGIADNT